MKSESLFLKKTGEVVTKLFPTNLARTYHDTMRATLREIMEDAQNQVNESGIGKEYEELKNSAIKQQ